MQDPLYYQLIKYTKYTKKLRLFFHLRKNLLKKNILRLVAKVSNYEQKISPKAKINSYY